MVKQPSESLGRRPSRGTDPSALADRASNQDEASRRRQSLAEKMRERTRDAGKPADEAGTEKTGS